MIRAIWILCLAGVLALAIDAWGREPKSEPEQSSESPSGSSPQPRSQKELEDSNTIRIALNEARSQCSLDALNSFIASTSQYAADNPSNQDAWSLLAEGHLERALQRTHLRGITVGKPTFSTLPTVFANDIQSGLNAVAKARGLGKESSNLFLIEAGLLGQKITGLISAVKWNSKITEALDAAKAANAKQKGLYRALGLRKLLAPRFFGNDPKKALEHFEVAAKSDKDERTSVYAGMACFLQEKRARAITWLERAVEQNPNNKFAKVVLRRLRRGEEDPFGRDVTELDLSAIR
jgi:tetratricopeptide (TPR) repeat protein